MPLVQISPSTMQLLRAQRPPGFQMTGRLLRLDDGSWLVPVSDDVVVLIVAERVHGESDDGAISRLLNDAARKPALISHRRRTGETALGRGG